MTHWLTSWDAELQRLFPTMTRQQLADHFGVNRSTVNKRCTVLELYRGAGAMPGWEPADVQQIKALLADGLSLRRVSYLTGYSRGYLMRLLKRG